MRATPGVWALGSSHFFECDQLLRYRFSNEGYLCAIDLLLRTSCLRLLCTSVSFFFLMTLSSPVWSPTPTSRMFQFISVKTQRSGGVGCSTDHLNVADEWACNRRHRLRPRESSRQEPAVRTEGKLDVLCLEGRAPAVHCELARKGCDVLDKVVGNVLHYLIFASRDA